MRRNHWMRVWFGVVVVFAIGAGMYGANGEIVIAEAVSAPQQLVQDEDLDHPDWIEILNNGSESVDLGGYGLSDRVESSPEWVFPESIALGPGERLVVFASGKNRRNGLSTSVDPSAISGARIWLEADMIDRITDVQLEAQSGASFVTRWRNLATPGVDAVQGNALNQPELIEDAIGGRSALRFGGGTKFLDFPLHDSLVFDQMTCFVVMRAESRTAFGTVFGQPDSRNASGFAVAVNAQRFEYYVAGGGWPWTVVPDIIDGTRYEMLRFTSSTYESTIHLGGGFSSEVDAGFRPTSTAIFRIGAQYASGTTFRPFAGDIALLLIYDRVLESDEVEGVTRYIRERYPIEDQTGFHVGFKLDSDGETIVLSDPSGAAVDQLTLPELPIGVSFGRSESDPDTTGYMAEPTPGEANPDVLDTGVSAAPVFSHASGFHPAPFMLSIVGGDEGATIYYTLDGSVPDENSIVYDGSIAVEEDPPGELELSLIGKLSLERDPEFDWKRPLGEVRRGMVVRARAKKPDGVMSPTVTRTYFVQQGPEPEYSVPVVSIAIEKDDFFHPVNGIYVRGEFEDGSPKGTVAWPGSANFNQSGEEWEVPANVELIEIDGTSAFNGTLGARIFGNFSRTLAQKSIRFRADPKYGMDKVEYPLFPEYDFVEYDQFILRNGGNDWRGTYFRDPFMQGLLDGVELSRQASRPVVVFLNGEYWGLYTLTERIDEHYVEHHFDVGKDDALVLRGDGGVATGKRNPFTDVVFDMTSGGVSDEALYEAFEKRIDYESLINFYVANIFYDNADTAGNTRFWKELGDEGIWRWMIFDTDFGFGGHFAYPPPFDYDVDTLSIATRDQSMDWWYLPPEWTVTLRTMLRNQRFRDAFANRMADFINTRFSTEHVLEVIDEFANLYEPEVEAQTRRWPQVGNVNTWRISVESLRRFARIRPDAVRGHVVQKFGLSGTGELSLTMPDGAVGHVLLNSLTIDQPGEWSGEYFQGIPVNLEAVAAPGFRFVAWDVEGSLTERVLTVDVASGDVALVPQFAIDTESLYPNPHVLAEGDYEFSEWPANAAPGSYPDHMRFRMVGEQDPSIEEDGDVDWDLPYNLESRSRIVGGGDAGVVFANTGNPQEGFSGYAGEALLVLDSSGVAEVWVEWTAETVTANPRPYALRLQYRVGGDGPFLDVTDRMGGRSEYASADVSGVVQRMWPIRLPDAAARQPHVELRWKYHALETDASGPRCFIRLDDVKVSSMAPATTFSDWSNGFGDESLNALADLDEDGAPNVVEMIRGTSPVEPDQQQFIDVDVRSDGAGGMVVHLSYSHHRTATGYEPVVSVSTDLDEWMLSEPVEVMEAIRGEFLDRELVIPVSSGASGEAVFCRLGFILSP